MSAAKTSNQQRAPISAKFVEDMREVFGADQVKVLYVKEGNFELGEKTELGSPYTAGVGLSDAEAKAVHADISLQGQTKAAGADARGHASAAGKAAA